MNAPNSRGKLLELFTKLEEFKYDLRYRRMKNRKERLKKQDERKRETQRREMSKERETKKD